MDSFLLFAMLSDGAEKWPKQKESDFLLLGKQGEKGSNCCDYTTMLPFERNPPPPSQLEVCTVLTSQLIAL